MDLFHYKSLSEKKIIMRRKKGQLRIWPAPAKQPERKGRPKQIFSKSAKVSQREIEHSFPLTKSQSIQLRKPSSGFGEQEIVLFDALAKKAKKIGVCELSSKPYIFEGMPTIDLKAIYLFKKELHGKSIAPRIINYLIEREARKGKAMQVKAEVNKDNRFKERAIAMFKKLGFEPAGTTEDYLVFLKRI